MFAKISDTILIAFLTILAYVTYYAYQVAIFAHYKIPSSFIKIELESVFSTILVLFVAMLMLSFLIEGLQQLVPTKLHPNIKKVLYKDIKFGVVLAIIIFTKIMPATINYLMIGTWGLRVFSNYLMPFIINRKVKGISNKFIEYHTRTKKESKTESKNDNSGLFGFLNSISPTLAIFVAMIFVSLILSSFAATIQLSVLSNYRLLRLNDGSDYVCFTEYKDKLVTKKYVQSTNTLEEEIIFIDLDEVEYMYYEEIVNLIIEE